MPYRACSVKGCFYKNTDNNSDISFFSTSNDALKQKWLSASPFGWKTHKNLIICSEHFVDDDFAKCTGQHKKRLCKPSEAVPSQFKNRLSMKNIKKLDIKKILYEKGVLKNFNYK